MNNNQNVNNYIPESVKTNLKSADEIAGHIQDGYVEIIISENGLTAKADFYHPIGIGHPLDLEYFEKLLETEDITEGIKWDVIKNSIFECNTGNNNLSNIVIAEGIKPKKEIPGYIRMEEKFFNVKKQLDEESDRIDYRSLTPYLIAKKKEKLGHLVARRKGTPGKSVTGAEIPFVKKNIIQFKPGENTRVEKDQVIALCSGRFILSEDNFRIEEVLQIEGGVDYKTGHIRFPGDVVLNGEVQDGFYLISGGSIVSKVTIDASEVIAKKNLVCDLGIIGKKKGLVRVGGDVKAKFIDNCIVEARGSVFVEDSIHTSRVLTLNRVDMGEKGRIIAGSIRAVNGINAWKIGNRAGQHTEIFCGEDFTVKKKLSEYNEKLISVAGKLKNLETKSLKEDPSEELENAIKRFSGILEKLTSAINELTLKLDSNHEAKIEVKDKVYPGVYIEICRIPLTITTILSGVRFYLDTNVQKIITEKLT